MESPGENQESDLVLVHEDILFTAEEILWRKENKFS
jgi:hypothetical protein